MWVTLNIVTLLSLLAALGCFAVAARRLDARLGVMIEDQMQRRLSTELDLASARASLQELRKSG